MMEDEKRLVEANRFVEERQLIEEKRLADWKKEKGNTVVSKPIKNFLIFFSFLLWLLSGLFAALAGLMIARDYEFKVFGGFAITPSSFFASIACYLFVVSSFGVLGALRENICCLRLYKYSLTAILLLVFCAGLLGFAFWPEIKKIIDTKIRTAIRKYVDDPNLRDMIDMVQRELGCCGSLRIDDWDSNPYFTCFKVGSFRSCGVPWSCCLLKHERNRMCGLRIRKNRHKRNRPFSDDIHTTGCLDAMFEYLRVNMYYIGGISVACTFLMMLMIYALHMLVKQIRKQRVVYEEAKEVYQWNWRDDKVDCPFDRRYQDDEDNLTSEIIP